MAIVLPLSSPLTIDTLEMLADCVRDGGVLAVATESSYAIAAGVSEPHGIERVLAIKGDRQNKPLLALIADMEQASVLTATVPPRAACLIRHFWPGPLTLVFPAKAQLHVGLTGGGSTVAVRQPGIPVLRGILQHTGPLTGTSANRSGGSPCTDVADIQRTLGEEIDILVDSGPSHGSPPSTVLDVSGPLRLIREGPISWDAIQAVLVDEEGVREESGG